MSKFLLTGNWELPALPLLDKFLGDGIACKDGGVKCVEVEEVKDVAPVKNSSLGDGVLTFVNEQLGSIRVLGTYDKPLFNFSDACNMLGYKNNREALRKHVEPEDVTKRDTLTKGGLQPMTYVTEAGLYCLIFGSKVEGAKVFKKWVTNDVIPSIRKTGSYGEEKPSYQIGDPIKRAERWIAEEKQRQALMLENKEQKKQLEESSKEIVALSSTITQMQPKVTYFDVMIKNKSTSVITSMAQDYGMSAQAFNKKLNELGIQHKVADQWVLYRQYLDKGYVNSEPITITHNDGSQTIKYLSKWTQRGRFFLYGFLKANGVLPLIERNGSGESHQ